MMKPRQGTALLVGMALPMLISAQQGGSAISACGDQLPEGSHYSVRIDLDWDRRGESPTGGMSVSLTDARTGTRPEVIPAEATEFVRCVMDSLGVPASKR